MQIYLVYISPLIHYSQKNMPVCLFASGDANMLLYGTHSPRSKGSRPGPFFSGSVVSKEDPMANQATSTALVFDNQGTTYNAWCHVNYTDPASG